MDGNMPGKDPIMAKKYVALDPRTGKPIEIGQNSGQEASYEVMKGKWSALRPDEIMNLVEGRLASRTVRWEGKTWELMRKDGVRALSNVPKGMVEHAHGLLLDALQDHAPEIRIAALEVLPEFAVRKSDELFDWLSVLLDDENENVRRAASDALTRSAPTFPSGVRSSLINELRSSDKYRSTCAWKGLEALAHTWPDVVAEHVDSIFLEDDLELRRKATKLLNSIVSRNTPAIWDLVSWALNDEDVVVRRTIAKSLPRLGQQDVRLGTMFAERAIVDSDAEVRLSAIKTIEKLNRGHGRARDLILAGTRARDIRVRRSCIALLPKFLAEDDLRGLVDDLLKTETDKQLVSTLLGYRFDAALEGSETQKNAALSPALPIPNLDKEILKAAGKRVGLLSPLDEGGEVDTLLRERGQQRAPPCDQEDAPPLRGRRRPEYDEDEDHIEYQRQEEDIDFFERELAGEGAGYHEETQADFDNENATPNGGSAAFLRYAAEADTDDELAMDDIEIEDEDFFEFDEEFDDEEGDIDDVADEYQE